MTAKLFGAVAAGAILVTAYHLGGSVAIYGILTGAVAVHIHFRAKYGIWMPADDD